MKKYRNWLMLVLITLGTFYLAWWILAQYKVWDDYNKSISSLDKTLVLQVQPSELKPYVKENADAWVYVANTHHRATGQFENSLKKLINQYQLADHIILCNISGDVGGYKLDVENILIENSALANLKAPMILYYRDGILVDGFDSNKNSVLKNELVIKRNNINDRKLEYRDMYNIFKNYSLIDGNDD